MPSLKAKAKERILIGVLALFFCLFTVNSFAERITPPNQSVTRTRREVPKPNFNFAVNPPVRIKNSQIQVLAGRKDPNSSIFVNDKEVISKNGYQSWYYEYPLQATNNQVTVSMAFVPQKQIGKTSFNLDTAVATLNSDPPVITGFRFADPPAKDFILTIKDPPAVLSYNIYYADSLNSIAVASPFILAQGNYPVSGTGTTEWRDNGTFTGTHPSDPRVKMRFYRLEVASADTTPPTTPVVSDDGQWTKSSALRASWTKSSAASGIVGYEYKITQDSSQGPVIKDWSSISRFSTGVSVLGLSLQTGKTYYFAVKAKSRAGLWSEPGYSDGITLDTTPPTGSIKINDGEEFTTSCNITLQLSAIDPENGLFQMRFSRDKQTWSAFEPYATTKQWELEPETGPKDFYVKFSDYAANESEVYHSSITYLRPLKITDITPADGASFYESDIVSISPTLNTTDTSSLEYQFSIDGVIRQAWSTLSSYSWTPTSQDKGSHNIKVEVRDISGQDTRDVEVYIFRKPLSPP